MVLRQEVALKRPDGLKRNVADSATSAWRLPLQRNPAEPLDVNGRYHLFETPVPGVVGFVQRPACNHLLVNSQLERGAGPSLSEGFGSDPGIIVGYDSPGPPWIFERFLKMSIGIGHQMPDGRDLYSR